MQKSLGGDNGQIGMRTLDDFVVSDDGKIKWEFRFKTEVAEWTNCQSSQTQKSDNCFIVLLQRHTYSSIAS